MRLIEASVKSPCAFARRIAFTQRHLDCQQASSASQQIIPQVKLLLYSATLVLYPELILILGALRKSVSTVGGVMNETYLSVFYSVSNRVVDVIYDINVT